MKNITVLQLVEELKVGGLERIISDLAIGLNKNRFNVSVWCISRGGETANELIKRGIDVKVLDIHSYHNPVNILKLAKSIREDRPDILHTHTYFSNTIGRIAGKLAHIPIIISHVHNVYTNYSRKNLFIERVLSFYTDKIICCSKAVTNFVIQYEKVSIAKTVTIHNAIDLRQFQRPFNGSYLRQSLLVSVTDPLVISVASLTHKKGHRYLLEAIAEITKRYKKIKCLIVGDGPLRNELDAYVRKLGIQDSVIFTGIRYDIPDLLRIADIFALPSLTEGLPLAAIEALTAGIPVVATNVGGVSEVVEDGKTGVLVPPKDSKALSDALLSLLHDTTKRKTMGMEGKRTTSKKFSLDKMLEKIARLYESCIEEKQNS